MTKSCVTCKYCVPSPDGNLAFAKCTAVRDPFDGEPLLMTDARRDMWNGFVMPCKYEGLLWVAKE